jgi:hypothetical protein
MRRRTSRWVVRAALVVSLAAVPFAIEWALPDEHLSVEERFELDRAFAELEHRGDRSGELPGGSPDDSVLPWDDLEGEER